MERNDLMMMMMMMQGNNSAAAAAVASRSLSSVASSSSSSSSTSSSIAASASASAALHNPSHYQQVTDDALFYPLSDELTLSRERKAETERALMEELMASLRKEEKLLEADAWKYAAPRSQLQLTSMLGNSCYGFYQEPLERVNKRKRCYHNNDNVLPSQTIKGTCSSWNVL